MACVPAATLPGMAYCGSGDARGYFSMCVRRQGVGSAIIPMADSGKGYPWSTSP